MGDEYPAVVVENPAVDSTILNLTDLFLSFEAVTGLRIVFRPLSARWARARTLGALRSNHVDHLSTFCMQQKSADLEACIQCDNDDAVTACNDSFSGRAPLLRRCHAGVLELLLPIRVDGVLVAIVFLGQFDDADNADDGVPQLPTTHIRDLTTVLSLLRDPLVSAYRTLAHHDLHSRSHRQVVIHDYLRASLASGASISGLAALLHLSVSRASRVIHEATGHTFSELVEIQRISIAKDLLAHSSIPISDIGRQVGITDPHYFSRYFRKSVGLTPSEYRRDHSQRRHA